MPWESRVLSYYQPSLLSQIEEKMNVRLVVPGSVEGDADLPLPLPLFRASTSFNRSAYISAFSSPRKSVPVSLAGASIVVQLDSLEVGEGGVSEPPQ